MHRTHRTIAAGLAVTALLMTACGDDDDAASTTRAAAGPTIAPTTAATETTTAAPTTAAPATTAAPDTTAAPATTAAHDGMAGIDSGAAELRAGLTSLLQEHVYLAGAAIASAVQAGGDLEAAPVQSAVATLDENSVALSEVVGSVYGDDAGQQFLELWRAHIGFFVDYTLGGATGDAAMQTQAKEALDAYRADFGAFVDSATGGELSAEAVAENLQMHVNSLIEAVDSILAESPDVYRKLRAAAQHMPGTAQALAGAIAAQMPDTFAGDVASGASELRSGLTHLLQEHVYLAGAAIAQAVADGGDLEAPFSANAVATLDENSVALSEAVGSVYGDDAGQQFLELWRAHIGFFVDYTLGGATGDAAMQTQAKEALDAYRADFGAFVDSATGGELSAEAVAENLQMHVNSLIKAVDSVLATNPNFYPRLRAAAQHMPGTAQALAGAIAAQMPDQFPA